MRERRRATPVLLALAVSALAAGAAGCGSGAPAHRAWRTPDPVQPTAAPIRSVADLPAGEIVERALKATQSAASVRIHGAVSGEGAVDEEFVLDLRYDATGGGGRIRIGTQTVDVLRIQREVWFAGDAEFWRRVGGERAVADYRSRYLKIPAADERFAPLLETTYLGKVVHALMREKSGFVKKGTVMLRGQQAVVVAARSRTHGGTLWVAAHGPPYLLRLQAAKGSDTSGAVDFLDYNKRFPLPPPDPRRVIDAADLAESGA